MTSTTPGTTAGDEPYGGPPPTLPPQPAPWVPAPWAPGPWQAAPWPPASTPSTPPSAPPPWAQERWGPAAWGSAPAGPPPWQPAPWPPGGPPAWGPAPWGQAPWGPGPWGPPPWGPAPWGHAPSYPPRWLPPGTPPHDEQQPFLLAMRSRTWRWWRPAVGLLIFVVVYAVAAFVTLLVGGLGLFLAAGADFTDPDAAPSGPGLLLVINLVTAVAIPVVWLAWGAVHRMRIGWSSSVLGRLRWRLFPSYVGFALLTIGVSIGLSLVLAVAGGWEVGDPVESYGWLVVVVLLTTPLQSAAEEYMFRGYLSQAIAGWVRSPRAGPISAALLTAALFSVAHLPPDLPTFVQFFFVGLAASAVVWLTGGLEAAIALHTVNNVVIFVLVGALGEDVTAAAQSQAGVPWFDVALSLVALSAFVALVARARRRQRPETSTAALDLRPPAPVLAPAR